MKKYRRLQTTLAALVAGTFALGMVSAVRPAGEIFPFASWFLFSLVPQRVIAYEIRVREWKDRQFHPPKSIIEVDGLVRNPHSSAIYQIVQRYGAASDPRNGRPAEAAAAWDLLRARLTSTDNLSTKVVRVTYDPMERSKNGRVIQEEWLDALKP